MCLGLLKITSPVLVPNKSLQEFLSRPFRTAVEHVHESLACADFHPLVGELRREHVRRQGILNAFAKLESFPASARYGDDGNLSGDVVSAEDRL